MSRILWTLSKGAFRGFEKAFLDVRIRGHGNIPPSPFLLVSNHASFLDAPLLAFHLPVRCHFLARADLFRNAFGWWLRHMGAYPVSEDGAGAIRAAVRAIRNGESVAVFPEGTRTRTGSLQKPHPGAAAIAQLSKCTILPSAVIGTFAALPPGSRLPRRLPITVVYGKPIELATRAAGEPLRECLSRSSTQIMTEIDLLLCGITEGQERS